MTDDPNTHAARFPELALRIEYVPITDLRPAGRQARHHNARQLAAIKKSISQFGFIDPVVTYSYQRILAGNARIEVAKSLGMTTIPCVAVDHMSPEEQRAYVLADNRLAELGSWNKEVLALELEELATFDLDFSLDVTGFSLPEIEAIRFGVGDADPGDDDIPEAKPESVSRLGDVWRLGDHRLLVGSATDPAAVARLLSGDEVRVVFTDPPYNVPVEGHVTSSRGHGEFVQASGEMSDAEFTSFLTQVMEASAAALCDGGIAFVCMDWRHMTNVLAAAEAAGLAQINHCVWDKGSPGMGSLYRSQHELVFVLKKGKAAHLNAVQLGKNGRNRSNVWSYPGVSGFGADKARERAMHPTVKPLALVKDALLDVSNKGDLVLDLFGGSGTTLMAAEKSGRRCRMMELDPKYADVIIRRWEALSGKEAAHEALGQSWRTLSFGRPHACPPARVRVRVGA
ncbi:MAG TPA: DNA methyltransferase [Caulobacteraceae bacterium]|jgi:DNA modification methylase|nr:DNA methyltransferase [Caulobacteraceae bacterium]